ncbi:MAG TPA: hypothetical protein VGI23_06360, partial [Steroidobacteraceae bacterium]
VWRGFYCTLAACNCGTICPVYAGMDTDGATGTFDSLADVSAVVADATMSRPRSSNPSPPPRRWTARTTRARLLRQLDGIRTPKGAA